LLFCFVCLFNLVVSIGCVATTRRADRCRDSGIAKKILPMEKRESTAERVALHTICVSTEKIIIIFRTFGFLFCFLFLFFCCSSDTV
jgi:hypothetical protein